MKFTIKRKKNNQNFRILDKNIRSELKLDARANAPVYYDYSMVLIKELFMVHKTS